MTRQKEAEQIKALIKAGFDDVELLSFELDIPLYRIISYKAEVQEKDVRSPYWKMEAIRNRYKQQFGKSATTPKEEVSKAAPQETREAENVVVDIEERMKKYRQLDKANKQAKIDKLREILEEAGKIKFLTCNVGQLIRVSDVIREIEQEKPYKISKNTEVINGFNRLVAKSRESLTEKLIKASKTRVAEMDNIEELEALARQLRPMNSSRTELTIGVTLSQIDRKIAGLQNQQAIAKIKSNIPESVKSIISDLANGIIDLDRANNIIDAEAKRRVDSKPKTRFSLTQEQERGQILIQIKNALSEQAEQYPVVTPQLTIEKLQELGVTKIEAVRITVGNLIGIKEFEQAKGICNSFSRNSEGQPTVSAQVITLRDKIRHAEVGNMVMQGLKMRGTPQEELAYFKLIEQGINMGNISLKAVPLGKSADGLRTITLADIWQDGKEQQITT